MNNYCTCDELDSGMCGFCQGIGTFEQLADIINDDCDKYLFERALDDAYLEDEEFDDKQS